MFNASWNNCWYVAVSELAIISLCLIFIYEFFIKNLIVNNNIFFFFYLFLSNHKFNLYYK